MTEHDVLIVGSGSTGGALAGRLTELSGKRVLVLEAGPVYRSAAELPEALLLPGSIGGVIPGHPNNWAYPAEVLPGLDVPFARGKGLGGSSSINGCYWIRARPDDFDNWVKAGNGDWSYDAVLPYFVRGEADQDFTGPYHGADGPVPVHRESADRAPEFTEAFTAACRGLGHPEDADKNAPGSGGVGPVPMNIANGVRMGTALSYLVPALGRPNLEIIGNAVVQRILFEGTRAVGVEALVDGEPRTFRAAETVISAGVLRSPQVLMHSGIGPAEHLRGNGISVVADLPGVGQNLTDHPMVMAAWDSKVDLAAMPGRGTLTSALHWNDEGSELELLPFIASGGDMLGIGAVSPELRQASLSIVVFEEDSRGSVTLASGDPADLPVLRWNLLAEATDRARFRAAVRVAHEVYRSAPLRAIGAEIVGLDDSVVRDDDALDGWVRSKISSGHPTGTCKMGPDSDPSAVVDQQLRVRGVEGLRVADTSIFPTIPTRGPNATAMMVGERLADLLV